MEGHNVERLKTAQDFDVARGEWSLVAVEISDEFDNCPCGQEIKEHCYIRNRLNGRARLTAGETVLVTGASGGVGSAIIQLARARGAFPIAVTAPGKEQAMLDIGAEAVVEAVAAEGIKAATD